MPGWAHLVRDGDAEASKVRLVKSIQESLHVVHQQGHIDAIKAQLGKGCVVDGRAAAARRQEWGKMEIRLQCTGRRQAWKVCLGRTEWPGWDAASV